MQHRNVCRGVGVGAAQKYLSWFFFQLRFGAFSDRRLRLASSSFVRHSLDDRVRIDFIIITGENQTKEREMVVMRAHQMHLNKNKSILLSRAGPLIFSL